MSPEQSILNAKLEELQEAMNLLKQGRADTARQNVPPGPIGLPRTTEGLMAKYRDEDKCVQKQALPIPPLVPQRESETITEIAKLAGAIAQCSEAAAEVRIRLELLMCPAIPQEKPMKEEPSPRSHLATSIMNARLEVSRAQAILGDILNRLQV